jgi:thiol:disulfide interchange protein DsbG
MKISKKTMISAGAFIIPGLLFASSAFAASSAATQLITKVTQGNAKIIKSFPAIANLEGFVVGPTKGQGQKTIIYADKDGKYMVAGALIGPNGQNITQTDFAKYVTAKMMPKIFANVQKTSWIQQGNAKAPHKAYILVEPNCIACHMLYKGLKAQIKSGQLAVRWVFLAFLKPSSLGQAAAIIQSNDPAKAFAMDEKNFNDKTETGGIAPTKNIDAATKQKIQANMKFMTASNFIGTPVIIYKDSKGEPQVVKGFIPGKALQKTIAGMSGNWS